jgi:hypothetical protein
MGDVVQFRREPWQRQVCKMTGMVCMATVEACCICKHENQYRDAVVAMYGAGERELEDHFGLARGTVQIGRYGDLIQFAKTRSPKGCAPETSDVH